MLQSRTADLEKPLTKEESYVQRRQLFKDIWETALAVNEKEDIMSKPKVIKTLRMDEIDRCPVGQSKKQRIKNLRHVCKRILDFCDRQDAEDKYMDQGATNVEGFPPPIWRGRKLKHKKKKLGKVNSLVNPKVDELINVARVTMSVERNNQLLSPTESSNFANKRKGTKKKSLKHKIRISKKVDFPNEVSALKRKIKKKRTLKKKKITAAPSRTAPYIVNY